MNKLTAYCHRIVPRPSLAAAILMTLAVLLMVKVSYQYGSFSNGWAVFLVFPIGFMLALWWAYLTRNRNSHA